MRFLQGQKREERTPPYPPLDLTAAELRQLQKEDKSLEEIKKAARGELSSAGAGFFERDGLLN